MTDKSIVEEAETGSDWQDVLRLREELAALHAEVTPSDDGARSLASALGVARRGRGLDRMIFLVVERLDEFDVKEHELKEKIRSLRAEAGDKSIVEEARRHAGPVHVKVPEFKEEARRLGGKRRKLSEQEYGLKLQLLESELQAAYCKGFLAGVKSPLLGFREAAAVNALFEALRRALGADRVLTAFDLVDAAWFASRPTTPETREKPQRCPSCRAALGKVEHCEDCAGLGLAFGASDAV